MNAVDLQTRKQDVIEFISKTDEKTFSKIEALIKKSVGSIYPRIASTKEELIENVKKAEEDIKAGRVLSHAEVRAQFGLKEWK